MPERLPLSERPRSDPIPADAPAAGRPGRAARLLSGLRDRDHTRSTLLGSLIVLSVPAILQSLAGGGVFQMVDLYFLGRLGPTSTAAVGMTNQALRQVPFFLLFGCCIATQMMVARMVGAGRSAVADHIAGQALVVGAMLAATVAAAGLLFPRALLDLVTEDPAVLEVGVPYLRLAFGLMFGQIFVMLFSFILTGAGESTTPLLITVVSTPVTIFTEWCLIFGNFGAPELGIRGVALGVATGTFFGVGLALWVLLTGRCRVHLRLAHFVPRFGTIRRILGVMWQPALHMVARTLIVIYFMGLAGRIGTEVQAAYTIGLRIELVTAMVGFPIANACATLVGQNLAAGSVRRAWHSIFTATAFEVSVLVAFAAVLFFLREPIVDIFTDDPAVASVATEYLLFSAAALCVRGFYFVGFRALQGAGDMNGPMLISIGASLGVGAPLAWVLVTQTGLGATGMWIANLTLSVLVTALTVAWLARGHWTRIVREPLPAHFDTVV